MSNLTAKATIVLIIAASVPSFRRAGEGFTNTGTAFPIDHFNDKQRAIIDAEPKLSIKEVSATAIPDTVDASRIPMEARIETVPDITQEVGKTPPETLSEPAPEKEAASTKPATAKPKAAPAKAKA